MAAAVRTIFDQLHRRIGIAQAVAALRRLGHHLRPVAAGRRRDRRDLLAARRRRYGITLVTTAAARNTQSQSSGATHEPTAHLHPFSLPTTLMADASFPGASRSAIPRASASRHIRSSGSSIERNESPISAVSGPIVA